MAVTLDELKTYLRVDYPDDDALLERLLEAATRLAMDAAREEDPAIFWGQASSRVAVLYAVAYLYEHREDADMHELVLMLRAVQFANRKAGF